MKNWKKVPIPDKMRLLERDKRGYPVPYIVARDINNIPKFQINDHDKVTNCINNALCSVCGQLLGSDVWLVGGPMSAFHPHGSYIDPPGHRECIEYSLQVCPYLINVNYKKRIDMANVKEGDFDGAMIFVDPTQDDNRVPFFVAVHITGYILRQYSISERYIVPNKPYLEVRLWNEGRLITDAEAEKLYREHISNPKNGVK